MSEIRTPAAAIEQAESLILGITDALDLHNAGDVEGARFELGDALKTARQLLAEVQAADTVARWRQRAELIKQAAEDGDAETLAQLGEGGVVGLCDYAIESGMSLRERLTAVEPSRRMTTR